MKINRVFAYIITVLCFAFVLGCRFALKDGALSIGEFSSEMHFNK